MGNIRTPLSLGGRQRNVIAFLVTSSGRIGPSGGLGTSKTVTLAREDGGQYRLQLKNPSGFDTATINVKVLDRPKPVRILELTNLLEILLHYIGHHQKTMEAHLLLTMSSKRRNHVLILGLRLAATAQFHLFVLET
uniref:Uncharacterized protein n=1 Tax=Megaselia scalaris TaxID=36166 RepID=T1GK40_MEGSC